MNLYSPNGAKEGGGDGVRSDEAAGEGEPGPQLRPLPRPLQQLVQGAGLHLRLAEQLQGARHGLHDVAGAADVPGGHLQWTLVSMGQGTVLPNWEILKEVCVMFYFSHFLVILTTIFLIACLSTVDTLPGELELLLEVDQPPPEPHVLPLQPLGLEPLLAAALHLLAAPPPHLLPPAQQL